jgi:hypothetical protein
MSVHRLFGTSVFGPDEIAQMSSAYEDALRLLHISSRSDSLCEVLARKIIEIAQTGESDPKRIREKALSALGIQATQ